MYYCVLVHNVPSEIKGIQIIGNALFENQKRPRSPLVQDQMIFQLIYKMGVEI